MLRFILVRVLQSLAALAILSVVVFVLARATGDPLHMILPMSATEEDYANARAYLGLDRPYVEQYLTFVGRAVIGDFGTSIRARRPVMELIQERLPNSIRLALFAMGISLAMALPLGVMAAVKKGTGVDRVAQIVGVLGQSLPTFWVAIVLVEVVAGGCSGRPPGASAALELHPAGPHLGWFVVAGLMRLLRSGMLEVLTRVRQACARQGRGGAPGDLGARAEERAHSGGDVRRHLLRHPGHHRHCGGDRVRLARARTAGLRGHHLARLPVIQAVVSPRRPSWRPSTSAWTASCGDRSPHPVRR
jgi:peptide/nickel transport system permease protein